jgi:hypothetical protein
MLYRAIEIVDGISDEPVNFVGVHPVRWPIIATGMPDVGFAEFEGWEEVKDLVEQLMQFSQDVGWFKAIIQHGTYTEEERQSYLDQLMTSAKTQEQLVTELQEALR